MVLEIIGGVIGVAMVGLLYKIARNLGSLDAKLAYICEKVADHEKRIRILED